MGKSDLFVARRDPGVSFGHVKNLGYPINSIGEESGLFVTRNGQFALISSERPGGFGRGDLYRFELPIDSRPFLASFVAGTVVDSITGRPLEALVEIIRLSDQVSVYQAQTLPADGSFLTSLPHQERYALQVQKNGYLFYGQHFDLNADTANASYLISLSPIRAGREVVLQNVFFAPNESVLDTLSHTEIVKLSEFLNLNRGIRLEIQGHTDDVGGDAANLELSGKRARSVYDALLNSGIEAHRLSFRGYGESRPIADNQSELGRRMNRRTSFVVLPD
jgi:outer membrane protein OmpA-like peptidoglycan-associated protein